MRFAIALPTYLYSEERKRNAARSYASLLRTDIPSEDCPLWISVVSPDADSATPVYELVETSHRENEIRKFNGAYFSQRPGISGTDQSLCCCVEGIIQTHLEVTHIIYLTDDLVYHPRWFIELKALISRHPDARAWSVYRSAHDRHHKTRSVVGDDHEVTSLSGNGTCFTVDEWKAWGVGSIDGSSWPVPTGGNTLDLHHAYHRPGERWATGKSYIQHIGMNGLRVTSGVPEYALDFVGEDL